MKISDLSIYIYYLYDGMRKLYYTYYCCHIIMNYNYSIFLIQPAVITTFALSDLMALSDDLS